MHELIFLKDLLIILSVAVIVVVLFHRIKLPAITGFILSGFLVGPQGFGLIEDFRHVETLAEIGVALLLFGIGLELPLTKLKKLWKIAVTGGLLQVSFTTALVYGICKLYGIDNSTSIFIGFIVTLSSTAIVLRGLQQRGEVDAPHGQLILGILVFQDFSVIPMMLVIPMLLGTDLSVGVFVNMFLKSTAIIIAVLLLAVFVVPRILKLVTLTRQRQLFILTVFVVCLGTAWLVTESGASLAIGAFLAGLVVAGSEYRHQAMADMISFREVFASLFFVSIGMLLLVNVMIQNLLTIILILSGILLGKFVIIFISAFLMKMPLRASLITASSLAQVGEFSFVLLYAVKDYNLIDNSVENNLVTAAIISMFITPFFMSYGLKLATGLGKFTKFKRFIEVDSVEDISDRASKMSDYLIIAGYGFAGRELSMVLKSNNISYIVVDINIENIQMASKENKNVVYGDITSEDVLVQLGIENAKELVLLINDPGASEHAIRNARRLAPDLYITVRTTYLLDIEPLLASGANEVIAAEREAAIQVASVILKRNNIEINKISKYTESIRDHLEKE